MEKIYYYGWRIAAALCITSFALIPVLGIIQGFSQIMGVDPLGLKTGWGGHYSELYWGCFRIGISAILPWIVLFLCWKGRDWIVERINRF